MSFQFKASRNDEGLTQSLSQMEGESRHRHAATLESQFNQLDYSNPFAQSSGRQSPPIKQSSKHNQTAIARGVLNTLNTQRNDSIPKSLAEKLIQNHSQKRKSQHQNSQESQQNLKDPNRSIKVVDISQERDFTNGPQQQKPQQPFQQQQDQLKVHQSSQQSIVSPHQLSNMSVDDIIAMAAHHKKSQSISNNNLGAQQQHFHSLEQSPQQVNKLANKTFANNLVRNSMNTHQGEGSYEKMIQSKVFQFLNGFFANQQQTRSSMGNSTFSTQGGKDPNMSQAYYSGFNDQGLFNQSPISNNWQPPHAHQPQPQPRNQYIPHQQNNGYQRSVSPILSRGANNNNDEINEIKSTTYHLGKEMRIMRKLIEDLSMSLNEKDAEIIKLTMHLGDEKKKFQNLIRKQSQKSLLKNASSSSLIKKSLDSSQLNNGHDNGINNGVQFSGSKEETSYEMIQQLREENQQLSQETQILKKQNQDISHKHKDEIKKIEEARSKEKQRQESHIHKLENYIEELKREIKKHQDEAEKALKIHRANEALMQKNEQIKQYVEKLNQEIDILRSDKDKDQGKYQQLLKHAQMLSKNSTNMQKDDGPCKSCINALQEKEENVVEMEELRRQLNRAKKEYSELQQMKIMNSRKSSDQQQQLPLHETSSRSNQIIIQQLEQQYKQQIQQYQQEIELKDEVINDLQRTLEEMKGKESQFEQDVQNLQSELEKNNSNKNQANNEKVIEQLKLMIEKNAIVIMEEKGKSMQMQSDLERSKVLNQQLQIELQNALDPKKKKKK